MSIDNKLKKRDYAVSEVIAAILLISLVIIGISMVSVMLTSGPPPQDLPKASVQIVRDSTAGDTISFYHSGGDPFSYYATNFSDSAGNSIDRNKIYISKRNISSGLPEPSKKWSENPELLWDYSSIITLTDQTSSDRKRGYQIHHLGGSGEYLIKEFGDPTYSEGTVIPTMPSYGPCEIPDASFTCSPGGTWGNEYTCNANDARNTHSWTFTGKNIKTTTRSGDSISFTFPIPQDTNNAGYIVQHTVINSSVNCSPSSNSSIQYISVNSCPTAPCVAGFRYRVDGSTVYFNVDDPSSVVNCSWDFGDGQYVKGISYLNPHHTYLDSKAEHDVTLTIQKERCGQIFPCSTTQRVSTESVRCSCFNDIYNTSSRDPWRVNITWDPNSCVNLNDRSWKVTFDFGDNEPKETYYKDSSFGGLTQWPSTNRIHHSYNECRDYSVKMDVVDLQGGIYYTCTKTVHLPCICNTNPVPAFTATPITPSNLTTIITDTSTPSNIIEWVYDLGDGSEPKKYSSKPAPFTHPYAACGTYVIKLIVRDAMGCWAETTRAISCGGDNCEPDDIRANFRTISDPSNPMRFQFTDSSNSVNNTLTRWEWNFGDGTSGINTSTPGPFWIEYDTCSSFPVKLRVWDDIGCWNDYIQQVRCNCPEPIVSYRYDQNPINPLRYQFYDDSDSVVGSIKDRIWEFGDGIRSNLQNPSHTYSSPGQYTVRLTVMNDCGSTNDTIFDIMDGCPPPVSDFEYRCIGERTVNFTDLSRGMGNRIKSWSWEFGDTRLDNRSNLQNPTHEYDNPGTYQVNLTISTFCNSSARWTRQVSVPCCQMPTADFKYTCLEDGNTIQFNDTTKLYGDTISSWNWNFGDGSSAIGSTPKKTFVNSGTYPVNLTVTTACGAKNSWIHNITVPCLCSPPLANFNTEIITRKPFTLRFTDTSDPKDGQITHWNWTFGDGTTHSGQNPPDKTYLKCGEFIANLRVTNDCGAYDDTDRLICCPVFANYTYRMDPPDGDAPVTVYFTDITEGTPNAWEWNFGDGETSYLQSPVHTYTQGGSYTVSLHATSPCGGNETHSKILTIGCPEVIADFSYTIVTEEPFNVSFMDFSMSGAEIVDWTWFFGDGQTSKEQNPTHQYAGRANYNIGLIVKNSCGNTAQMWRRISYDCPDLTPDFIMVPSSGNAPLVVQFTDNSTPLDKIMSWQWFFGDGTSYFTISPPSRNPPDKIYTTLGSYYVTLQIKNECGNPYGVTKMVNVTSPATIGGYLWNDNNQNRIRDPEEEGLSGWQVVLQERVAGSWIDRLSMFTAGDGSYSFSLTDVTYGTFRVRQVLPPPPQPQWKPTFSYRSGEDIYSDPIVISTQRVFDTVNFGNVRWKTSSLIIPGYLSLYNSDGTKAYNYYYSSLSENARYFEFTTSVNPAVQQVFLNPIGSQQGTFTIPPYSAWGNSSFTIYPREYNTYFKTTHQGESGAFYLRYWNYNGVDYAGIPFIIPDNTAITATQLELKYYWDPVIYFKFDKPFEGEKIPYTNSYRVEVHYQGPYENRSQCYLISPVSPERQLVYNTSIGEYIRNIDTRPWEGTTQLFTARMYLNTDPRRYEYTYVNATIGWEPLAVAITNVQSEVIAPYIKGTTTVTGTVGGKWRDNSNVWLVVNDDSVVPMNFVSESGTTSTFSVSFDPEAYAGKIIPLKIRAFPLTDRGDMMESAEYMVSVLSRLPIEANFTTDPWTGPAPLEVSFIDTTTGGPASWLWDFDDGFTSVLQHPIHIFQNEGEYLVSLTASNLEGDPSSVSHYVNTTGLLQTVNLQTNRNGYLHPGYVSWIVRGSGSNITVNGTEYSLDDGDRVRLDITSAQTTAKIQITGEITDFQVNNLALRINGVLVDSGECTEIQVFDYENYHSNIRLTAYRQANTWINLVWAGIPVTVQVWQNLDVMEIMPSADKILDLEIVSGNIYLDGRASSYNLYS